MEVGDICDRGFAFPPDGKAVAESDLGKVRVVDVDVGT